MLRRRLLAGLALAGLPLPVGAKSETCGTKHSEDGAGWYVNFTSSGGAVGYGFELQEFEFVSLTAAPLLLHYELQCFTSGQVILYLSAYSGGQNPTSARITNLSFGDQGETFWSGPASGGLTILDHEGRETEPGLQEVGRRLRFGQTLNIVATVEDGRQGGRYMAFRRVNDQRNEASRALARRKALYAEGQCTLPPPVSPCYLTMAAVQTVGLADDCWELRTLRRFRDRVLGMTATGRALVEDYYRLAPIIVAGVSARPDARRVWLLTYWLGIVPSAVLASLGLDRVAVAAYRCMTNRLRLLAS